VRRGTALPGAVLTRVAASHVRVGTFQYFAARGDAGAVRLLADHAIARHYPESRGRSARTARCWRRWWRARRTSWRAGCSSASSTA
jgi:uncharacterized protein YdiU (UPF0061 family)